MSEKLPQISVVLPEGQDTIHIKYTETPKPIKALPLIVEGHISAPAEFFKKRSKFKIPSLDFSSCQAKEVSIIDPKTTHILVDRLERTITLIIDEAHPNATCIKGTLKFTDEYKKLELGIPKMAEQQAKLLEAGFYPLKSNDIEQILVFIKEQIQKIETEGSEFKPESGSIESQMVVFQQEDLLFYNLEIMVARDKNVVIFSPNLDTKASDQANQIIDEQLDAFGADYPILEI